MSKLVQHLRRKYFGNVPNDWQTYHLRVAEHLRPGMTVVDVGCGPGLLAPFPWEEHPDVRLIGIDPDAKAQRNSRVDEFRLVTDRDHWPIEDAVADIVLSRYVLEHVQDPDSFLREVRRILKPQGVFIFLTPNFWTPVMLASHAIPHRLKKPLVDWLVGPDIGGYPTFYRLNSPRRLVQVATKYGFKIEELCVRQFSPNGYLDRFLLGFACCWAHYAVVTRTGLERWFGGSILGVFRTL